MIPSQKTMIGFQCDKDARATSWHGNVLLRTDKIPTPLPCTKNNYSEN